MDAFQFYKPIQSGGIDLMDMLTRIMSICYFAVHIAVIIAMGQWTTKEVSYFYVESWL